MVSTEDKLQIHEVLARMDHAVDAGAWDVYVSNFTEDGVLESGWTPPVQGRDAIRRWLVENEAGTSGKRHVATNVTLDPLDDGVRATSYLTVIEREDIPKVVATAVIIDDLSQVDGAWKVRRHEVRIDPGMMKAMAAAQGAAS